MDIEVPPKTSISVYKETHVQLAAKTILERLYKEVLVKITSLKLNASSYSPMQGNPL